VGTRDRAPMGGRACRAGGVLARAGRASAQPRPGTARAASDRSLRRGRLALGGSCGRATLRRFAAAASGKLHLTNPALRSRADRLGPARLIAARRCWRTAIFAPPPRRAPPGAAPGVAAPMPTSAGRAATAVAGSTAATRSPASAPARRCWRKANSAPRARSAAPGPAIRTSAPQARRSATRRTGVESGSFVCRRTVACLRCEMTSGRSASAARLAPPSPDHGIVMLPAGIIPGRSSS
jgi:hypothetical protein